MLYFIKGSMQIRTGSPAPVASGCSIGAERRRLSRSEYRLIFKTQFVPDKRARRGFDAIHNEESIYYYIRCTVVYNI